ncbi:MAG: dihydroorotase [Clostridia bacterium]|nr:dihydroorotase [Clostridia bacterium]
MTYLIKNARLIDPANKFDKITDILIEDKKIIEIGDNLRNDKAEIINAQGLVCCPGFVDLHAHFRDPGQTEKEDIISGSKAAAAGGYVHIFTMPNTVPAVDNLEILEYIKKKSEKALIKIYPIASVTKELKGENITDFETLSKNGAYAFSDDGMPIATSSLVYEALELSKKFGKPIFAHCEDLSLSSNGVVNEGEISKNLDVKGIPSVAEDIGTIREILIAKYLNAKIHICHVSTKDSAEIIRLAKNNGVKVTAEATPHHFSLDETLLLNKNADCRMSPPLRTKEDVKAIRKALKDNTIDVIATDHAPHTKLDKNNFENAKNGSIGLETALSAGITYLVKTSTLTLYELIEKMTCAPAKIAGIKAGNLSVGGLADLVLFDPNEEYKVEDSTFHGKSTNSAFKNLSLFGKVKYTFCNGNIVYKSEE